ncbi:MAG: helix-turn-helix transcriptional regulator [Firmicutes bacterium]|nr:helix-turn-helix transcriptional regulator [Bacillota bacterium]
MILADKIIMLRKKCGWSQEELAEKLNVSRQSVSKWEGAQSVPDLDKILQMSKIFGVTTDYLLKDEIEDNEMLVDEEHEEKDTRWVTVEEARAFIEVKEKTADKVAAGVSLCILSPVIMFMLIALSESHRITMSENTASAIGIISLIMIVTTAVALFVTSAMKTGAYEYLEKEFIETAYGVNGMVRQKKADYADTYNLYNVIGVCSCILAAVPLIGISIFTEDGAMVLAGLSLTLIIVSVGVNFLIRSGIRWASYQKLLQEGDYAVKTKKENKVAEPLDICYWIVITAVYLGYSFVTMNWERSWIIWPVAAVFFVAVRTLYLYKKMK